MKEKLYKKEIALTIIFSIILVLMGHTASIFVLFPGLQTGSFWGFPTQYIVPILTGWFGLTIVSWIMTVYCNRFDDEMEAYINENLAKTQQQPVDSSKSVKEGS